MTLSNETISFSRVVEQHQILAVLQPTCASPDWMRLGVTRNPYARFYWAWENRVFLPYPGAPVALVAASHDVLVDGQLDLGASFRGFVDQLIDQPRLADLDHHFHPQVTCLQPAELAYTDLVDVSGVASLGDKIAHRTGLPFSLPRTNEGLGIDWRTMFDDRSAGFVEQHYQQDFDTFGYERVVFSSEPPPQVLPVLAVRLVDTVRQRDTRIWAFAAEGRRTHVTRLGAISLRRRLRSVIAPMRRPS